MSDEFDKINTEENVRVLLLAAIQAYELENSEPFSVSNDALSDVLIVNQEEGTTVPAIGWFNDLATGRTQFTVKWYDPESEDIRKLLEDQKETEDE
ncbi:hypothetical protein SEA_NICEHOUSE_91 [Rhodococcus phage NiceHouse]|nr:hypothetical protein SEA_NICEHOUSE_91 [Rhodococcus phage NiceHouse]